MTRDNFDDLTDAQIAGRSLAQREVGYPRPDAGQIRHYAPYGPASLSRILAYAQTRADWWRVRDYLAHEEIASRGGSTSRALRALVEAGKLERDGYEYRLAGLEVPDGNH